MEPFALRVKASQQCSKFQLSNHRSGKPSVRSLGSAPVPAVPANRRRRPLRPLCHMAWKTQLCWDLRGLAKDCAGTRDSTELGRNFEGFEGLKSSKFDWLNFELWYDLWVFVSREWSIQSVSARLGQSAQLCCRGNWHTVPMRRSIMFSLATLGYYHRKVDYTRSKSVS